MKVALKLTREGGNIEKTLETDGVQPDPVFIYHSTSTEGEFVTTKRSYYCYRLVKPAAGASSLYLPPLASF